MLMKKAKKGFTLIELVVVIAVIAILAAISVISFTTVTNKAKESNDHNIIDQINLALKGDAILNKKTTVHNLVENLVEEEGFDVRNLKAEVKDARFVYSYEKHMFGYLKNNQISYPKDLAGTAISSDLWLFLDIEGDSTTKKADLTTGEFKDFSCYVRSTKNVETIKTKEGLDVGKTTGISAIEYINSEEQSVLIRTNSAKTDLSIAAPNDTVKHYGSVGSLSISSIATSSYHEYGSVAFAEINTGRIVLEKDSNINHIHVNSNGSNAFGEVIIQDNGAGELPDKITRDQVDVSTATQVVKVEQNGQSETVYVYPYTDASDVKTGTTEKTTSQNPTISTALGQLVLDNGDDAGEKAMSNNEKQETQEALVEEAIEKEEQSEAADPSGCVHDYQLKNILVYATCLTGGQELHECSICHDQKMVLTEPLGHDLIGIYCNRCHHPVAFVTEVEDFKVNDPEEKMMPVAASLDSLFSPAGELYLDVSYAFNAFPSENYEFDNSKHYSLNTNSMTFIEDENGMFTAEAIYGYFADWYCDYYVSFDSDVDPFTCGLGGYYQQWGYAVGFLVPDLLGEGVPLPGNVEVPLLGTMTSGGTSNWTYRAIAEEVGEFICGFFNISEDNVGKVFTVKLRMLNPNASQGYDSQYMVEDPMLGISLPNYIDVAVTNYVITAPSAENMAIINQYLSN